jgi:antitoxin component of MazEF toxin-antitoxin module
MITTLTPIGDDLGVIIEPALLERLMIDRSTPLEVTTDGKGLTIRPVAYAPEDEVLRSAERMLEIHAETFKRLAE